ncbi:MAG: PrpF family protein [Rhodospirillales bacterium]|nr:PrpF family protein [Rhodospirillales bacterium]
MSQIALPAVFMRGGTSKGLFFHRRDLPADRAEWDALFLAALGSPDPHGRQLDGMGGGISSLSKVVVVSPSTRAGVDIDYLFGQVAVERALVDYGSNCGNLTAAVGPFAVDEGLVQAADGEAALTLHNCNLDQRIDTRFEVANGRAVVEGRAMLDGVSGQGAPIRLSFLEPDGAVTGRLLPTGHAHDVLDVPGIGEIEATLIDASTALVIVRADTLGLSGVELPDAIETDPALVARLEAIRRAGAVVMGLALETESVPKIGFVAPPANAPTLSGARLAADAVDLTARVVSMGRPHRALPLTAALALAAAARTPGTLADKVARPNASNPVRLGHPSGVAEVAVNLAAADPLHIARLTATRTARRLMEGRVLVPAHRLTGRRIGHTHQAGPAVSNPSLGLKYQ